MERIIRSRHEMNSSGTRQDYDIRIPLSPHFRDQRVTTVNKLSTADDPTTR